MAKRNLIAPRCIHMPAPENTVVIFSAKENGKYTAGFTIGNQDFTVCEQETKAEAQWYCDVLEKAFLRLVDPPTGGAMSELGKQKIKEMAFPKITIKNLK